MLVHEFVDSLTKETMNTISPFARPFYLLAKPAGSACNMACEYCYYLEKAALYKQTSHPVMDDRLLETFIQQYIEAQTQNEVLFIWHGGETLMRPLSFYQRVMELEQRYAGGRHIDNSIQTNATLLDDKWCEFFARNGWLVGVSIDGPQALHDRYRRMRNGGPSFAKVMRGIGLLNKHGVQWNALAVVNRLNADYPLEFYHFFKEIQCRYIQFTPVVERICPHTDGRLLASVTEKGESGLADFSVTPAQWGQFLCTLFDEWVRKDVGTYYIQLFDAVLANWIGAEPGLCSLAKTCGRAGAIEWNGDVYSCDHFVFPEYKLGNMTEVPLCELMYSDRQQRFGEAKQAALPGKCRRCPYLFACNGECLKNRFATTEEGDSGLNYLCEGYYRFFEHVAPYMDFMANAYKNRQAPAQVMKAIREGLL